MPDFGGVYLPPRINTFSSLYSIGAEACWQATPTQASFAWPAANLAIFIPVRMPFVFPVRNVFWMNGGTASGNVDVGYYTLDGALVFSSGATAQGAAGFQSVAVNNYIDPGAGYLAILLTSATGTNQGVSGGLTNNDLRIAGLRQQAVGAGALPATATFAQYAQTVYPLLGVER